MRVFSKIFSLFSHQLHPDLEKMVELLTAAKSAKQKEYKDIVKELQSLYFQIQKKISLQDKSRFNDVIGNLMQIMDNYDDAKSLQKRIDSAIAVLKSCSSPE